MQLNFAKLHEIVFWSRRLRGKVDQLTPPCPDIERVDKLIILIAVVNRVSRLQTTSAVYLLPAQVCCMPCEYSEHKSWLPRPVTQRCVPCYSYRKVKVLCASLASILFRWRLRATWVISVPLCEAIGRLCRSLRNGYRYVLGSWQRAVCFVKDCTKHTFFTLERPQLCTPFAAELTISFSLEKLVTWTNVNFVISYGSGLGEAKTGPHVTCSFTYWGLTIMHWGPGPPAHRNPNTDNDGRV